MANTIETIEKFEIFNVGYYNDDIKTHKKINELLKDGWKIKSTLMLSVHKLSVVFEKNKI